MITVISEFQRYKAVLDEVDDGIEVCVWKKYGQTWTPEFDTVLNCSMQVALNATQDVIDQRELHWNQLFAKAVRKAS